MLLTDSDTTFVKSTSAGQFIFSTNQSNLEGRVLAYDVAISSANLNIVSSVTTFTVYIRAPSRILQNCNIKTSWVTAVTQTITYDIRAPPASTTLATRKYVGPALSCGSPVWTYTNAGTLVSFLSTSFASATLDLGIVLTNPAVAVRGTYVISATFTVPGA